MLKETIEYKDYNDVTKKEDFYFNLTKSEVVEIEHQEAEPLSDKLARIVARQEGGEIMRVIKELIMKSYGVKSPDGRFIKSEDLSKAFTQTVAYDMLFYRLVTKPEETAKWIEAILPKLDA